LTVLTQVHSAIGDTIATKDSFLEAERETPIITHEGKPKDGKDYGALKQTIKAKVLKWDPPFTMPGGIDIFFVNSILKAEYGSPDHGNPKDPVDDLLYLFLTRKPPFKKGLKSYRRLKRAVGNNWGILNFLSNNELTNIINDPVIFEMYLKDLLNLTAKIKERFGKVDLSKLRSWSNKRCFEFLTGLPGVGSMIAHSVMMYTLGKKVFPANSASIRILARIGSIPETIISNNKKVQERISEIIPQKFAYDLHVNLVSHAQKVCTSKNPNCSECVIRKFCMYYRNKCMLTWDRGSNLPSAIDLFCGAGGTGIGLSQLFMDSEKFRISVAVDIDRWAAKTYWVNHPELPPERVLTENLCNEETVQKIRQLTADENILLIIGGPPCQDFSLIGTTGRNSVKPVNGKRFIEIEGNHNYAAFVSIVKDIKPRFFVMENVPAILVANGKRAHKEILEDFSDIYSCKSIILDAVKCGVPQRRNRVLFFGVKKETNEEAARSALKYIIKFMEELNNTKPITFKQAISDLPPLLSGQGCEFTKHKRGRGSLSEYQKLMRKDQKILFNHIARPNNDRDLKLYRLLKPGEIAADAIEKYNKPELMIYRNDVFRDKYKKQHWKKPCSTIVAHLAKDGHMFIHPEQIRSITVREAARIQSFPDDFIFCGSRTEQFQQVGNAVPPLMAHFISNAILEANKKFFEGCLG